MDRIAFLQQQLQSTRAYTLQVLEHADQARWLEMPSGQQGAVTHIAWHVGHLVFAEYAHWVERIAGETTADLEVIPKAMYFAVFGKGSTPSAAGADYPTAGQLLGDLHTLHRRCQQRLGEMDEASLDQPALRPHPIARTRFDMAMWWIKHEMLHCGQIALLRRLLGEKPWR